jgi:hypothetical protein
LRDALYANARQGAVQDGFLHDNPVVTGITPVARPNQAFIVDCWDATSWITRSQRSGTGTSGGRIPVSAVVDDVGAGTWKVTDLRPGVLRTC